MQQQQRRALAGHEAHHLAEARQLQRHTVTRHGRGQLHIDLHLRAVRLNADGTATRARLRGTYSLAWVWSAW